MGNADQTAARHPNAETSHPCSGDCGSGPAMTANNRSAMTARGCAMRTRNGRVVRFGEVVLPASKSESNRALMIAAYGGFAPDFQNLSDSGDTMVLSEALRKAQSGESLIDIADCGTAARFLTTYLACHEGDWLLTGTDRMKQRPMAPLVEALRALGADIQYVENEGCLPLHIKGKMISGGKVQMNTTCSSQFASSLLLASPMWPQGLVMDLVGKLSSVPYLQMTLVMMRHFGAECELQGERVVVSPKPYEPMDFVVDSDWSAASYWYEMAAFSEECEIRLHGLAGHSILRLDSGTAKLQGDAVIAEWMMHLGVGTFVDGNDIVLRKIPFEKRPLSFDFFDHPDLYPTLAATCAGLHVEACFTGLDNLHLKESDRVEAMQQELAKLGEPEIHFCAHGDHRIVMALAPLSMLVGPVAFDHPEVVAKSYPNFWNDTSFLHILP